MENPGGAIHIGLLSTTILDSGGAEGPPAPPVPAPMDLPSLHPILQFAVVLPGGVAFFLFVLTVP